MTIQMVKTHKDELKYVLLRILQHGRRHAISGKDLARRLDERDTRHIRRAIQELIKDGYPIIGLSTTGYYLAENAEDCEANLKTLKSYLKMTGSHYKYLKLASRNILQPGQIKMRL